MVIVAIDTSHPVGSVAVARGGTVVGSRTFGRESSHLAEIGPAVDWILGDAKLGIGDLDRVAVVNGPGSFTGLRIGLSFAKGLYAGTGAQIVTMGTLELLALAFLDRYETVAVMVDAHRQEVYAALFGRASDAGEADIPYRCDARVAPGAHDPARFVERVLASGHSPGIVVGTGVVQYSEHLDCFPGAILVSEPPAAYPSTEHLARVAHLLDPVVDHDAHSLEPDYMRGSLAVRKPLRPAEP